jgi:8-oxo-dGTP pyrophosphatase MutT (NUDIX family)
MTEPRKPAPAQYTQYAALPYRLRRKTMEVMLITSRSTRRWIIPKGWPKSGMAPKNTAAEEAYEEAGVAGKITKRPIGTYSYEKILKKGETAICNVLVFALEVTSQSKKWPEMRERKVEWFKLTKATKFVQEPSLRYILQNFAEGR